MFRKVMFVFSILTIFGLLGSGSAYAKKTDPPTWVDVFNPGMAGFSDGYLVNAVEVFKNELFAVVWGYNDGYGQLFRSKDGVNWAPATERGFGLGVVTNDACWTPENMYDTMWDMTVFHDELYLIPYDDCYVRPGQILRSSEGENWETVTSDAFGVKAAYNLMYEAEFHKLAEFQGILYVSLDYYKAETDETVSEVWRSASGDPDTWAKVMEFPGWGWPGTFHVFKGALYIGSDGVYEDGTFAPWNPLPEQIWRTFDGVTWEMVVADGFGNSGSDGLGGFVDYKGYLYVGVGTYDGNGGQIWRSPDGQAWEPVELTGFGNPNNDKIEGFITYQGKLYAYTGNYNEGCYVYSSKDGEIWTLENEPGWGNPGNWTSHHTAAQAVFKGDLYMGVFGWTGGIMKLGE